MDNEEKTETTQLAPPSSLDDLHPKMKLTGRVTQTDLYGAFVDIGVGRDALIHISRMKKGAVNRVDEVLSVGDEVTVYVDRVDRASNRVSLTMVKPLDVTWNELAKGQAYSGKITRIEAYGVFVDIGAERSGLVHISEFGDSGIGHPNELHSVNEQLDVRVLDFDRRKKRIDLGLVRGDLEVDDAEEDQDEEPPTAMELALRQALEDTDDLSPDTQDSTRDSDSASKTRKMQDDLLDRTLRERKS